MCGGRFRKMEMMVAIVCHLVMAGCVTSEVQSLITGQRVCRVGPDRPCYKLAYFSDLRRRLNFDEAKQACRRDGGDLLSVESATEQRIIEELVAELRPSDGDFWIGLRRNHGDDGENNADCSKQYFWVDGSDSIFRNWHWDEPSCGYEVCVVMYHQPSAPPGLGGMYMFQWNDDNCETKNNFICKYTTEKSLDPSPSPNITHPPIDGDLPTQDPTHVVDRTKSPAFHWLYILVPTLPLVLLLVILFIVCCYKLLATRRKRDHQKSEVCQTDSTFPPPSPASDDVYNVIRSQKDDDLAATRPQTKNTSFLCSSPDTPTGDYDNLAGRDTESGFVTLASTESGFLTFDLNDLSLGRRGNRDRDLYENSLGHSGKREAYENSLGRSGKREAYENSLGRSGKREVYEGSLGRYGNHRESYERSLGRRAGRSESYTGWDRERDEERRTLGAKTDFYDTSYDPGRPAVKADLYQTYISNGRNDVYQTGIVPYANRKSYHGYYGNEPSLTNNGRYFNEADWVQNNRY